MVNLGTVNEDSTVRFEFSTAAASGAEENFSATLEQADVVIRKDGADMTLDASTITITNLATGLYEVAIDTSNDADFTTGSTYWVRVDPDTETVDSVAVSAPLGVFAIESASEKAVRLLRESFYPSDSVVSTVTSNDTTHINLTDVVDAQTPDAALVGRIFGARDATDGRVEVVVSTAVASKVATVRRLGDGTAMSFTVAAGDNVWEIGYSDLGDDGTHLSEAGGTGDQLTALPESDANVVKWNGAAVAVPSVSGVPEVDLTHIEGTAHASTQVRADAVQISSDQATADNLQASAAGIITGAAATGTLSTTQATTDLTGYADDQLIGRTMVVTSGAAQGEATEITDSALTNGLLTFNALTTAMANGDTFVIV